MILFWVCLMGAFGGVLNSILLESGFRMPGLDPENQRIIQPGFLGNILLGLGAALATYFLGTDDLTTNQTLGIALIAGVGGGNILTTLVQRIESGILKAKIDALEQTVRAATDTDGEEPQD